MANEFYTSNHILNAIVTGDTSELYLTSDLNATNTAILNAVFDNTKCAIRIKGDVSGATPVNIYLDNLEDVDTTGVQEGDMLVYSGTTWVVVQPSERYSLEDLSDVDLTTPAINQILIFDGTNWVNQANPGGGSPASGATSDFWLDPVISFFDNSSVLPTSPTDGDRYIATATNSGWTVNRIYEWNAQNSGWTETLPVAGYTVVNQADSFVYIANGSIWVKQLGASYTLLPGNQTVKGVYYPTRSKLTDFSFLLTTIAGRLVYLGSEYADIVSTMRLPNFGTTNSTTRLGQEYIVMIPHTSTTGSTAVINDFQNNLVCNLSYGDCVLLTSITGITVGNKWSVNYLLKEKPTLQNLQSATLKNNYIVLYNTTTSALTNVTNDGDMAGGDSWKFGANNVVNTNFGFAIGSSNTIDSSVCSFVGGTGNIISGGSYNFIFGDTNVITGNLTYTNILGINITATDSNTTYVNKMEIVDDGEGVIMSSPDGTRYKITVNNSGLLTSTPVV